MYIKHANTSKQVTKNYYYCTITVTIKFDQFCNTMVSLNKHVAVIFISALTIGQSAMYRFLPDDYDLFTNCEDRPELGGDSDLMDLSAFSITFTDDVIQLNGTGLVLWDIEPTDRVTVDTEMRKFSRGTWQSSYLSVKVNDLCKEMKNTNSKMYDYWTKHIISEFSCIGKGVKLQHEPFEIDGDFTMVGMNMEGRYAIVSILHAYDRNNQLKPNGICLQIPGDIIKV
uniref:Uncharacterized protein n=1 Tax=Glossina brevipalpis TaxID=37001 RepID=A0A1A9WB49_9MUSC